jgi:myo-inositol-1(or 4)-monophosphatase
MASPCTVCETDRWPAASELERIADTVARQAAALVASHRVPQTVGQKSSPTDVVTATDLDAERLIRGLLAVATPDAGIVGEEGEATRAGARLQWVIDPLDGTVNFLYGVPMFAISIAAARDGQVVAGAVVDVVRDEIFCAHLGGGARRNGVPMAVSSCPSLDQALVATGFSYREDLREREGEVVQRVLTKARDIRCFGSAALELCWVGCGRVDAYYQRYTEVWDRAAGALIAAEAGAMTELPCPENDDLVIAGTASVFGDLWSLVQTVPG